MKQSIHNLRKRGGAAEYGANVSIGTNVLIGQNVKLGDEVKIGRDVIIYDNVEIGENSFIGPRVIIGEPIRDYYRKPNHYANAKTVIGKNSIIRSNSVIYAGNVFGDYLETGNSIMIREFNTFGHNCLIGSLCDFQGYVKVGNFCNFHSNVHVGQKSIIHDHVWIFPYVVLTNDLHPPCTKCLEGPTIGKFTVIATKSVILPKVKIGENVLIGAMSLVRENVDDEVVVFGNPGKVVCSIHDIKCKTGKAIKPYPWNLNFSTNFLRKGDSNDHKK